jgi:hypothetical protein
MNEQSKHDSETNDPGHEISEMVKELVYRQMKVVAAVLRFRNEVFKRLPLGARRRIKRFIGESP